jgi:hypothetical protein
MIPVHIQNALTLAGGKRLNGEPNYKFVWSGDFTYQISNGKSYEPFRVVAEDCWLLVKYELPDFWGTKEDWEINNWEMGTVKDGENGLTLIEPLYTAGPYPVQGRYRNIMRIMRPRTLTDGVIIHEHCAPTLQWVSEFFPGVRDFLDLSVAEKVAYLESKEKAEKAKLAKDFAATRENYRGIATAKQIQDKTEAIERFLKDPKRVRQAMLLRNKRRLN